MNVIDLREQPYRWREVVAVLESAFKNNEAEGADKVTGDIGALIDYAERPGISVREAMQWAEGAGGPVTLYLYDMDADPPQG
ncbi:MAG: hypothetical protein AAF762_02715 [Pseudomonadota bacterium]